MLFPTYDFLIVFTIIFILGIFLKKRVSAYKYFLLLTNVVFYSFFGLNLLVLLLTDIVINYLILKGVTNDKY